MTLSPEAGVEACRVLLNSEPEAVVQKIKSLIVFSGNRVLKVRLAEGYEHPVEAAKELAWLVNEKAFADSRLHAIRAAGQRLSVLVMERVPAEQCAAFMLVNHLYEPLHSGLVLRSLKKARLRRGFGSALTIRKGMCQNLDKQLSLVDSRLFAIDHIRDIGLRGLAYWFESARSEEVAWSVHGNLFSTNVFLCGVRRAQFIDPRLQEDETTPFPWIGDVATFDCDLLIHGQLSIGLISRLANVSQASWHLYAIAVVIKLLVRYRFAKSELPLSCERWRRDQNLLVVRRVPEILVELGRFNDASEYVRSIL